MVRRGENKTVKQENNNYKLIKMGPANCAVVGCFNSSRKIDKWKKETCNEHGTLQKDCGCNPPFRLFMFPSTLRNGDKRKIWIQKLKRQTAKKTLWKPLESDRVCSEHFVDGIPTCENPHPTLKLGYDTAKPNLKRRELFRQPLEEVDVKRSKNVPELSTPPSSSSSPLLTSQCSFGDHDYFSSSKNSEKCIGCNVKTSLICLYQKKVNNLNKQVKQLKRSLQREKLQSQEKKPMSINDIKTDKKMLFYTGLENIALFQIILSLLLPFIPTMEHWKGTKKMVSKKVRVYSKFVRARAEKFRKLSPKDALLMTLMRLRLGLLNEDLADRFCISPSTCSSKFKTYIRLLSETIGKHLVKWIPKDCVRENMPKIFKKAGYGNVRTIIDCSEVFIERSKSLKAQAETWSDYKHHNTIKFLIGISPTGFISFLSSCYGGRASDKFICSDSNFYDGLDLYDEVMADRGFQIQEELYLKFCKLTVPPGARLKSQMTEAEVKKTKEVANLRIHVERAINRIKTFRLLKYTLPITMLHHCDDIVKTCAALCNLKPLLYKESSKSD